MNLGNDRYRRNPYGDDGVEIHRLLSIQSGMRERFSLFSIYKRWDKITGEGVLQTSCQEAHFINLDQGGCVLVNGPVMKQ